MRARMLVNIESTFSAEAESRARIVRPSGAEGVDGTWKGGRWRRRLSVGGARSRGLRAITGTVCAQEQMTIRAGGRPEMGLSRFAPGPDCPLRAATFLGAFPGARSERTNG